MQTVLASGNIYDVLYSLAEHYPEKEFHFHEYCHDGYWHDFDFAFKNGEYVKWNYEDGDVYDELEDDEEFD